MGDLVLGLCVAVGFVAVSVLAIVVLSRFVDRLVLDRCDHCWVGRVENGVPSITCTRCGEEIRD